MRLIIMFDLPVTTKEKRKSANQFRNFLKKDGYQMLPFLVYVRISRGRDTLQKHKERLINYLPSDGHIRCMEITEKPYANIPILREKQKITKKK